MKRVSEVKQLLYVSLEELRHWNAGPTADHFGNVLFINFLFDQWRTGLFLGELLRLILKLILQLHQLAVLQLRRLVQIVVPFGFFNLDLDLLDLLADRAQPLHGALLGLPLGLHAVALGLEVGELFLELGQALF